MIAKREVSGMNIFSLLRIQTMISNGVASRVNVKVFQHYRRNAVREAYRQKPYIFCHQTTEKFSCRVHFEASINSSKRLSDVALILCVRRKRKILELHAKQTAKEKKNCLLKCILVRNCISIMDVSFKYSRT